MHHSSAERVFSREQSRADVFFAIRVDWAFKRLYQRMLPHGCGVMAIVDDNYVMGPPAVIFPANDAFAENLKEVGLKLQPVK